MLDTWIGGWWMMERKRWLCVPDASSINPLIHPSSPLSKAPTAPRLLQIDPAPILRAALDPGARRPRDAGFVDVLTEGGIALVAIVNDKVEAEPLLSRGQPDLLE